MSRRFAPLAVAILCALAAQFLGGCGSTPTPQPIAPAPSDGTPAADALDVVSAEAEIVPHKKALLSFGVPGSVAEVLVSEGAVVQKGQELMRLKTQDLEERVQQAEAMLQSAQAQLEKAKAGARVEEIAEAEAAVRLAQGGLLAKTAAVSMAQGNVKAAQADLKNAEDGVTVAQSGLLSAQAGVNIAQANLNKLLAGPTAQEIGIAEARVQRAKSEQAGLEAQRDASFNLVEGYLEAARAGVRMAELQLKELKAGARAEDLAAAKALVSQANGGVQTAHGQVSQAGALLEEAQAALQVNEARLALCEAQREEAEFQLAQAQALRDLVKAGSRSEDLAIAEAAVAQAKAALAAARNALEDTMLRAPFSGIVGDILLVQGETALPQAPAILVGDLTQLLVETDDVSQAEIAQIQVGQDAQVTVDALDGQVFEARVLRLAPVAGDLRGDKVYVVTLSLEADPDAGLRWGMSAFVEIDVR